MSELSHPRAPVSVRTWLKNVPSWVDVTSVIPAADAALALLGLGEREAIQLAEDQRARLLLIDERRGRMEATRRGLITIGTLGVLVDGAKLRLVDPNSAYDRLLAETTFRTSAALEAQFFSQVEPRRSVPE